MGAKLFKLFKKQSPGNEDRDSHQAFLKNHVDPDHGLLDELLRKETLDREEIALVRAERTYFERNSKLMEYIFNKGKEETFLLALKDSDQNHIAKYIKRDGVYEESCGDCWPLTESQISTLELNEFRLKELLVPEDSGLLTSLYSAGVINNWQRQNISSKGTDFEKNQALLDILRRRSKGDYKKTIRCLHDTNQGHIAQVLENVGAIARIHSRVRIGQQENQETDEAIVASFVHMLQNANLDQTRSIQILQTAIKVIALRRVQSINIYVLCKSSIELEQLKEMQSNGKLANAVSSFFIRLLKSAHVEKLEVNIEDLENIDVETHLYDEENERCMAYLSSKEENDRIRNRVVTIYEAFVSEVDPKNVIDFLIQNQILNVKQKHHLNNQAKTEEQCEALLDLLHSCSKDNAFIILKEALKEHYTGIVERIDSLTEDDEYQSSCNRGSTMRLESSIIVFGGGRRIEAFKINLNRPDDVSALRRLPIRVDSDMAAAVYSGSVFVTGIGEDKDEIWRFNARHSKWNRCASMTQGRARHSVAFVDQILYICGGCEPYVDVVFDDVEAYDAIDDKCSAVGKLTYAVYDAGNCVPYNESLYIFGGSSAQHNIVNSVQVYNTKLNSCTILKSPMPRNEAYLRAALLQNYVILLGKGSCFLYNFDTGSWEVSDQFKTGVDYFGMTVHNEKLFVIGGIDLKGIVRGDVRYISILNTSKDKPIEWEHHAKLSGPFEVYAFEKLEFLAKQK